MPKDEINCFTSSPSQAIWRYGKLGEKVERDLSASIYFAEDSKVIHGMER